MAPILFPETMPRRSARAKDIVFLPIAARMCGNGGTAPDIASLAFLERGKARLRNVAGNFPAIARRRVARRDHYIYPHSQEMNVPEFFWNISA